MIVIALAVTRIEISPLNTWHGISMTFKVAIVKIFRNWGAIRDLCTKYNVNEIDNLVTAQRNIEDGILRIPRDLELTKQLAEAKWVCEPYEKKYETEVFLLGNIATQRTSMKQSTADTFAWLLKPLCCRSRFLKKACNEIRDMSGRHKE